MFWITIWLQDFFLKDFEGSLRSPSAFLVNVSFTVSTERNVLPKLYVIAVRGDGPNVPVTLFIAFSTDNMGPCYAYIVHYAPTKVVECKQVNDRSDHNLRCFVLFFLIGFENVQ